MTRKSLRLLLAEDCDDDALLVVSALERQGFEISSTRVMAADDFRNALRAVNPDIILCDFVMPSFDAMEALEILHESRMDVPLIIVSGTIGETVAVDAMKRGASDYLLKDNLIRLGAAVDRELREATTRRQKRLVDGVSQSQSEILELILDGESLPAILSRITQGIVEFSPDRVACSIMLAGRDDQSLQVGASSGFSADFFTELESVFAGGGHCPCLAAMESGEMVVFEDISRQSDSVMFRDIMRRDGLRSCWSVPLFTSTRNLLGTLAIYQHAPHAPTEGEIRWVESARKLACLAIERSRAAEQLRASEGLLRIASEAAHIGGWIVDFEGSRIIWSDQVCAIHEVPPGTSPAFDEALEFYAPEWRDRISMVFERCLFDGQPFDEELEIITAAGNRISVRAIGEGIRSENGRITRIQGAFQNITARRQASDLQRSNELRYLVQRNALISLTRETQPSAAGVDCAFRRITETTARTLGVGRVSVWRFSRDRSAIECLDLYELAEDRHSAGVVLVADRYPRYFEGLEKRELIAADDALSDPQTCEFAEAYLIPLGIGSMLDVPVRMGAQADHLLCCEHIGPARVWTPDEKTFAVAVANLIYLSLEIHGRTLAQEEVLRSHQRFQSVASATNDTIWDWNLETGEFWWNDGFAHLFGWASAENCRSICAWIRQIHPEDQPRVVTGIYAAIEGSDTQWSDEYRFVSDKGVISHVLDRGSIIRDADGNAIRMVGGMMDLTANKVAEHELSRSHRALQMLSSCNEMLVRAADEAELLSGACRIAVETGGYRMAWVGYVNHDELRTITPMAVAGDVVGDIAGIDLIWDGSQPTKLGPAGLAVCNGDLVVIDDVMECYGFSTWVDQACKLGYRSVVCLPLRDGDGIFGVFCLLGSESRIAVADEVKMLSEMANDLSFGIGNIRSREERRRAEEVVVKVAQAVSTGTGSEFFELLTRNTVEALGATGGLIGRYDSDEHTIHTLSYFLDGKPMENIRYELDGTPCENVLQGDICIIGEGAKDLYPKDQLLNTLGVEAYAGIPLLDHSGAVTGIMAVFFRKPIGKSALVVSTLRIFAARAASEMDRQQADARIREQASLLDKARDAILVRGLDHRITYWNKSAERMYGWTADEVLGRSVVDLLYREQTGFHHAHAQTLKYGEWIGELNQIDKTGRELTVEGRWNLVCDDKGRPQSVLAINTDISEYRKLEQQFIRAQRLESIGTLAGGIAHDLNNILAPISMAVELLKMHGQDERCLELLETISTSSKRGANMVGKVLSFARGMEGCKVLFQPRRILSEVETILRDTFPRNVHLEFVVNPELWTIEGDPTQIHQVLLNLCVNARDAISGAGTITITAENAEIDPSFASVHLEADSGPHVCIEVSDNGEGIPPEILDRIYDPFFTTKAVGKGTGLGLPTTLAIVKAHGGFIGVTSKPGEGTKMRVYFPAKPESAEVAGPLVQENLPSGNGELVLLVDDEEPILRIASETLNAFGYRTLTAADGAEGLEFFSRAHQRIDLVLTDIMMPVMDGIEMIQSIRKIDKEIPVIASGGIANPFESGSPNAWMIQSFLPKPYSAGALLKIVDEVLHLGKT